MTPQSSDTSTFLDPGHDLRLRELTSLDYIFSPRTVAVVGATEKAGSVGRTVLWNLISNPFGGTVYPVNPTRPQVLGIRAYPKVGEIPESIDLAVICTAAKHVPQVVRDCVAAEVKGIIIISAGFAEMGEPGQLAMEEIRQAVSGTDIRIIGPNCLGVMSPLSGLNATFGAGMARPGHVAFISQSGALCTAILDWSLSEQVGFSAFVSIGSMLDVTWGDLIDYFGSDPRTNSIVIYMESVGDARRFLSAAREVALSKPIIVIKAGRTAEAAKAAASHTGTLTGSDDVLDAAFRRVGVMRVNKISDLFAMSEVLGKQPLPRGPRLTIVTNAGGPGVLATDSLAQGGGKLTQLGEQTHARLNEVLPPHWSRNNPVDVLGDATPEVYAKTLEITAADENADGLLVILTPQDMTDSTQTAHALTPYANSLGKPVLASWMGGAAVQAGRDILQRAGIPTFEHPDDACEAFNYLWRYSSNLRAIYETPGDSGVDDVVLARRRKAGELIDQVRAEGRTLLDEYESKQLLEYYGIPTVRTEVALNADEAVVKAADIGYPVVLKLYSRTITHKTDVGGVKLNLADEQAVREAFEAIREGCTQKAGSEHFLGVTVQKMAKLTGYELILGSSDDPQFGPVVLFGTGGSLVEIYQDRALGLPPLNEPLARRLMERTRIFKALGGVRGQEPVDLRALQQLVVSFSELVAYEKWIAELDINPLLASSDRLLALDARVVLHPLDTPEDQLPMPAIRPYPSQYVTDHEIAGGRRVWVRPIRPEDTTRMIEFHNHLSEQTVINRFHHNIRLDQRTTESRMIRVCFTDYAREMALAAVPESPGKDDPGIVGVVRLRRYPSSPEESEFSLIIADAWQGKGLGKLLITQAIHVAKQEKIRRLLAYVLSANEAGLRLCRSLGFEVIKDEGERVRVALNLD